MLSVNKYSFNTFQASTKNVGVTKPAVNNKLSIFYFNDLHGNTDKMHLIMEAARNFEKQKGDSVCLTLSGGDNVSGGDKEKNNLVFDVLQNTMNVDASAAGNHEFDACLSSLIENAKNHKTKFVATNVEFDDDNEVRNYIERSSVIEKQGVKFGLVGAMPIDFESCTKKAVQEGVDVLDFEDSVENIQKEIDSLKAQGVNKIILLSHLGFEIDKKMASQLSGVDIIIGGHSHSVVNSANHGENVIQSKTGEPIIITQAGENGKFYGILDVEFDSNGVLTKISNQLTPLSSQKSPVLEHIKNQKLGHSNTIATISKIEAMPENRRITPHAWGNLIVDSMRSELNGDVAFLNAANIRKIPSTGNLTERDVSESVPMKNRLIKTKVTQKQMVEAIKNAASESLSSKEGEPGLLYASGIEYKIDEKGTLLELYVIDKKGKKEKIDINNPSEKITYTAIYDDFTMRADGEYPALAPKFDVKYFDYDKDVTAIKYIQKMKNKNSLEFSYDNRIEIVKTSQQMQANNSSQKFLDLTVPKAS